MNNKIDKNLNIAGKLSLAFINHPLTFIFGVFILVLGYISLIVMPREENPQIKVSGGVVIVALPGANPSEIQKVIIEPLGSISRNSFLHETSANTPVVNTRPKIYCFKIFIYTSLYF